MDTQGDGRAWFEPHLKLGQMLVALLMSGCATIAFQNDGFDEKLKRGCKTEDECRQLQVEAVQRTIRCQPNTIGYVRCSDAQADKLAADEYLRKFERARLLEKEQQREADLEARQEEQRRAIQLAAVKKQREREAERQKQGARELEQQKAIIATCELTKAARLARKKHADADQTAAAFLRQTCKPRNGTATITVQCKDENGFMRSCLKQVPSGVVGYTCPKGTDPDVVKIGSFQLGLVEEYPFPEDRSIRVRDDDCDRATAAVVRLESGSGPDDSTGSESTP